MAHTRAGYRALASSERPPAPGAHKVGPADPNEVFSVSIRVRSRPDQPAPDMASHTAAPFSERQHLSREEFAQRHGAAKNDLDAVTKFAEQHGLKVEEVSAARRTVRVSGTVAKLGQAFSTELHTYQTAKQTYRGHEDSVFIPDALADVVESVHGFDNRQVSEPMFRAAPASPQAVTPLTPPGVAKLYNFPVISAAQQTIGILEFGGGYKATDIQAYFNNTVHLPVPTVVSVGVDGATNSPGQSADTEVILDIDVAGSVAPGARIVVYFAPNTVQGWIDAITTAVHDTTNRPSVLSISWAGGESGWGSAINSVSSTLQEAAAVGVTVFVSSGDGGSGSPAEVLYPASDPWVTGCGGTTVENVVGSSFTQVVWGGSGGGVSNHFPMPPWQSWAGIPPSVNPAGHVGRGVPDIAGNADPSSGYMLILNGAATGPWGGTSAVAPLYAGLVALLNATLGEPVGYLNYNLYAFAGPYVYRDITSGSNGTYSAKPNWDACTGFGTIDGTAMANALRGVGLPPALVNEGNMMLMAWKGMERDERIFYSTFNGTSWAPQTLIPGIATNSGVALAMFNGKVFMAWKGMLSDQGIYFSSFNGTSWAPQQNVAGVGTSTGPRLAVFNGRLYMAWKGVEGDQRLFWSTFNGTGWAPQQLIPGVASSVGPALAVFNNQLFASWKGMYGDQGIYWSSFNGTSWAPQKIIGGVASSEGPSLAVFNGRLYAAWKGMLADQSLWYSFFNGTSWAPQQFIAGVASSVGPGLCVFGSSLYAAWKGMLGDQRIWYSHFNGASWAPQQIVPGVGTSPDLIVGPAGGTKEMAEATIA
jgi:kumamolisin